jgi:hypothetical protein
MSDWRRGRARGCTQRRQRQCRLTSCGHRHHVIGGHQPGRHLSPAGVDQQHRLPTPEAQSALLMERLACELPRLPLISAVSFRAHCLDVGFDGLPARSAHPFYTGQALSGPLPSSQRRLLTYPRRKALSAVASSAPSSPRAAQPDTTDADTMSEHVYHFISLDMAH